MTLVVDASVGLKWVLREPDSGSADALLNSGETLLVPDFWLNEVANVMWVQVRRGVFTAQDAREGLTLMQNRVEPTPTTKLALHATALEVGMAVNHSTYDTLYVAFALAMGARGVVVADAPFLRDMRRHPDPALAGLLISLDAWTDGTPPT